MRLICSRPWTHEILFLVPLMKSNKSLIPHSGERTHLSWLSYLRRKPAISIHFKMVYAAGLFIDRVRMNDDLWYNRKLCYMYTNFLRKIHNERTLIFVGKMKIKRLHFFIPLIIYCSH